LALAGCSTTVTSAQWAKPADRPSNTSLSDDSRNAWSGRIGALPVELHGSLPNEPASATAARIPHAERISEASAAPPHARVVLFIDGAAVPERADFCALNPGLRAVPQARDTITLRAALCDGPRIVSYARKSIGREKFQPENVSGEVSDLKQALSRALFPPFDLLDVDD